VETCPHCGADLPPRAKACPACGSDEHTGWSEQARYDGLDLPDDGFDHADFVQREFAGEKIKPRGVAWLWWLVAVGLVLLFAIAFFRSSNG
jgi:uncharacterized membrane protein YvbJ